MDQHSNKQQFTRMCVCKQGYVKIQTYSTQSHTDYKVTYCLMSLIKTNNKECEKQKPGQTPGLSH